MPESALTIGDRVTFAEERHAYTVRHVTPNGRKAICTKPFNLGRLEYDWGSNTETRVATCLYCIVDLDRAVRGPDNYGGYGYETPEQIVDAAAALDAGDLEPSWRTGRSIPLRIARVRKGARRG